MDGICIMNKAHISSVLVFYSSVLALTMVSCCRNKNVHKTKKEDVGAATNVVQGNKDGSTSLDSSTNHGARWPSVSRSQADASVVRDPLKPLFFRQPDHTEVLINKGCFLMSELYVTKFGMVFEDGYFPHMVCLNSFVIDKHEITVAQYQKCIIANKCTQIADFVDKACNTRYRTRKKHPVNCASRAQSKAYCNWVGKRLPTEAEWEYAGRGILGKIYPWGNSPATCARAVMDTCDTGSTLPVGSRGLDRSQFGVYDLAGNVSEWVSDYYDPKYYYKSPVFNPKGPSKGDDHSVRGGNWNQDGYAEMRLTYRGSSGVGATSPLVGFRCARSGPDRILSE